MRVFGRTVGRAPSGLLANTPPARYVPKLGSELQIKFPLWEIVGDNVTRSETTPMTTILVSNSWGITALKLLLLSYCLLHKTLCGY